MQIYHIYIDFYIFKSTSEQWALLLEWSAYNGHKDTFYYSVWFQCITLEENIYQQLEI